MKILIKKAKREPDKIKELFEKWLKSKNLFESYMTKFNTDEAYRFRVEMYYDIIDPDNLSSFEKYTNSVQPIQWVSGAFQWLSDEEHRWSVTSWEWRDYLFEKYPNMRDGIYI